LNKEETLGEFLKKKKGDMEIKEIVDELYDLGVDMSPGYLNELLEDTLPLNKLRFNSLLGLSKVLGFDYKELNNYEVGKLLKLKIEIKETETRVPDWIVKKFKETFKMEKSYNRKELELYRDFLEIFTVK